MRTVRDGEPGTPTSTFTQLLRSDDQTVQFSSVLLYVHRDRTDYNCTRDGEARMAI